ncbi:hypothetical protein Peur_025484 [Populus x canadensis]
MGVLTSDQDSARSFRAATRSYYPIFERDKLTSAVPHSLKGKSNSGWLQLSLDENLYLCKMDACEKKQRSLPVPVIASVVSVSVLLLLSIITIFWRLKRRKFFLNMRYQMIL